MRSRGAQGAVCDRVKQAQADQETSLSVESYCRATSLKGASSTVFLSFSFWATECK
jgi:hypothetical protein